MDLTLHQLRLLLAVTEHHTISAAADALGYTPSAVSQQLAGLERACGVPVLERIGRNVRLTDAGRVLVGHARGLLNGAEAALAAVARVDCVVDGTVNISAYESVSLTLLPELLKELRQRHPALEVHSQQMDPEDGIAALIRGDLDLAFTIDYPHSPVPTRPEIECWTIIRDRFHLVVALDDPLPDGPVDLATLASRSFIGSPPNMSCGRYVVAACRTVGFEPRITHALGDYATAIRLIAAGEGVALIPDLGLVNAPSDVRILPLQQPMTRSVQLSARAASASRPNYLAVRDTLMDVANQLSLVTTPLHAV